MPSGKDDSTHVLERIRDSRTLLRQLGSELAKAYAVGTVGTPFGSG